jgi:DNA polymerase (family 10)
MDNHTVAAVLAQTASLLEIRGDNPFTIRAYRSAVETITALPEAVVRLNEQALRALPGVGKDLAQAIHAIATTGSCDTHQELLEIYPATLLDLLELQGVGPKTVARLHASLGVSSLDDLATAARTGRLRELAGMGAKKEAGILTAIEERQSHAGRLLLADATSTVDLLLTYLRECAPAVDFVPAGSMRRGCETCGDIDLLAVGGDATLMDRFTDYPLVERVLGHGGTKSSVRLRGGSQVDLRLVSAASRGAALQYFTGSKAHNTALRERAMQRGFRLNEYGLFRADDEARVAGDSEAGLYEALGLAYVDPELRENRGEIEAAENRNLPTLISEGDIVGDLHMHTTETDGRDTLIVMAEAAWKAGHHYIAITDHSQALSMANGLDERRALANARAIRALNGRFEGLTLLAGIECDILADGRLDLADDCLAELDIVVASIHSHFSLDEARMTDRILRAIENPWVDVLGHPSGRLLLRRRAYAFDSEAVLTAAADKGVILEVNGQPHRLDLNEAMARRAIERGANLVVSSDAHAVAGLHNIRWGVGVCRRAWATPGDVLNTRPLDAFRSALRRNGRSRS